MKTDIYDTNCICSILYIINDTLLFLSVLFCTYTLCMVCESYTRIIVIGFNYYIFIHMALVNMGLCCGCKSDLCLLLWSTSTYCTILQIRWKNSLVENTDRQCGTYNTQTDEQTGSHRATASCSIMDRLFKYPEKCYCLKGRAWKPRINTDSVHLTFFPNTHTHIHVSDAHTHACIYCLYKHHCCQ